MSLGSYHLLTWRPKTSVPRALVTFIARVKEREKPLLTAEMARHLQKLEQNW